MKRAFVVGATLAALLGCSEQAPPPKAKADSGSAAAPASPLLDSRHADVNQKAPAQFKVKFVTSKGDFTVEVTRAWSPNGADRFYSLVKNNYYDEVRFFRVLKGFMAQFGIHGDPRIASVWQSANIEDDPVKQSNTRGMLCYAKASFPNSRSTQIFINYGDNSRLDISGFSPFGKVIDGMEVVDKLYAEYGEGAPEGAGPSQVRLQQEGNAYLKRYFPDLDYIKTARIVP